MRMGAVSGHKRVKLEKNLEDVWAAPYIGHFSLLLGIIPHCKWLLVKRSECAHLYTLHRLRFSKC